MRGQLVCCLLGRAFGSSFETLCERQEFLAKGLGGLECAGKIRESILQTGGRFQRGGKLAQTFVECHRELIEFMIQGLQRPELLQDPSKLILKIPHRLEQFGEVFDLRLELPEGFKHICKLGKLLHRFQNQRDPGELLLKWLDLLKYRRYGYTRLKRVFVI